MRIKVILRKETPITRKDNWETEQSMFRLWAKIMHNNHMLREMEVRDESEDTRTHKVFRALETAVKEFDISTPIWLDKNIKDFKQYSKVRFNQDSFIETIDFDYLEIEILEEI